jgi:hypothetical protein
LKNLAVAPLKYSPPNKKSSFSFAGLAIIVAEVLAAGGL